MTKIVPLTASVETTSLLVDVTAAPGSAGQAVTGLGATSSVLLTNVSLACVLQFQIGNGEWFGLRPQSGRTLAQDFSSTSLKVRRATFDGGPAKLSVDADSALPRTSDIPANLLNSLEVAGLRTAIGFDLQVRAGQSNEVGTNVGTDPGDPVAMQFDCTLGSPTYGQIIPAIDTLKHPQGNTGSIGAGMTFAKQYVLDNPGRIPLLIPVAVGGTASTYWTPVATDPGPLTTVSPVTSIAPGGLYWNMRRQIIAAMTAAQAIFPSSRFVGVNWWQGESDANLAGGAYGTFLDGMIAALRAIPGVTGIDTSWFIINPLGYEAIHTNGNGGANLSASSYNNVDIQLRDVSARNLRTNIARGIGAGYNSGDNLHTSAAGQRLSGINQYAVLRAARTRTTSLPPGTPTVRARFPTDTSIYLDWQPGYDGGVVSDYLIEYSSNGGTTWSGYSRTVNTHTCETLNGLTASTAYLVRVSGVGVGGNSIPSTPVAFTTTATMTPVPVQLTGTTGVTPSANLSDGTFFDYAAPNGATSAANHAGVSSKKIAAGTDGWFSAIASADLANSFIQLVAKNTNTDINPPATSSFGTTCSSGLGSAFRKVATTAVLAGAGCVFRVRRSGGIWLAEMAAAAAPTAFKVVFEYLPEDTDLGDAFVGMTFFLAGGGKSLQKLSGWNVV